MCHSLTRTLEEMTGGDHLCLLHDSRESQLAAVVPYLRAGFARDERCLYVADAASVDATRVALAGAGVDVAALEAAGRLRLVTPRESYLRDGAFSAEASLAYWGEQLDAALADGRTGLRIVAEMSWALGDDAQLAQLLAYEREVNRAFPGTCMQALCQYDTRRFPPEALEAVLGSHSVAVLGDEVCPNPYYEPWGAEREAPTADARLAHRLAQLRGLRADARALTRSREEFRALAEHSPDLIVRFDAAGAPCYANAAARDLSTACLQRNGAPFPPAVMRGVARTLATGEPTRLRVTCPRTGASFDVRLEAERDEDEGRRVLGVARDVTADASREAALATSEARFRGLVESAHAGVLTTDADGRVTYLNARMADLLGEPADAVVGRPALALLPEADAAGEHARLAARRAGVAEVHELTFRRHDGAVLRTLTSSSPLHDAHGAFAGSLALVTDVTAQRRAEAALVESECFNHLLLDSSPDCVKLLGLDGRLEAMNGPGRCLMEVDDFCLVQGADWPSVWPGEGAALARAAMRAALAGETGRFQGFCPTLKGAPRWWDVTVTPVRTADGTTVRLLSVSRDITEMKRAEARLHESERRFRQFVESAHEGVWAIDADSVTTYVNPRLAAMLGYAAEAMIGRRLHAFVHPSRVADLDRRLAERRAGVPESAEFALVHADGREVWAMVSAGPLRGLDGGFDGALALLTDVTERRQQEVALRESEERLRLALQAADMRAWALDLATGRVSGAGGGDCAPDASSADGANAARPHLDPDALGTYEGFLACVHPEDRTRVVATHRDAVARAGAFTHEFRVTAPDGTMRWNQSTGRVLVDDAGRSARMVGVARDVTEQRRLEGQLRQAQKMEAIGRLAGGVAHDFNNLLTVIGGSTRFALEALPRDAAVRDDLAAVEVAAERATQLTRELLAFSRQQLLKPERLDLSAVVRGMLPMLARLIGEDIAIAPTLAPQVRPVLADPGQLGQVLMNLAVNARDAMPDGGRLVVTTADVVTTGAAADVAEPGAGDRDAAPGHYVRLTVRDTGVGMDEATLGQLFEPFFTTKASGAGTGLGLATVYGIVRQSGGHIAVTSVPGEGTTFTIDLPAVVESAPAEVRRSRDGAALDAATGTVLLVEDERAVRGITRRMLARAGYTVLEAENGREALEVLARQTAPVDVVVTDMVMPEMSGRAFADVLAVRYPDVRVLFVSGYTDDEILRRGLGAADTLLLEKPFTTEELLGAVRQVLDASPVG